MDTCGSFLSSRKFDRWYIFRCLIEINPVYTEEKLILQQDWATPHYSRIVHDLNETFPGRRILRRGAIEWPPWSLGLTPLDFFIVKHIKSKVCSTPQEKKGRIVTVCHEITPVMLLPAWAWIVLYGGWWRHFHDLLHWCSIIFFTEIDFYIFVKCISDISEIHISSQQVERI